MLRMDTNFSNTFPDSSDMLLCDKSMMLSSYNFLLVKCFRFNSVMKLFDKLSTRIPVRFAKMSTLDRFEIRLLFRWNTVQSHSSNMFDFRLSRRLWLKSRNIRQLVKHWQHANRPTNLTRWCSATLGTTCIQLQKCYCGQVWLQSVSSITKHNYCDC